MKNKQKHIMESLGLLFFSWLTCFFLPATPHGKITSDRSSSGKRHVDPNLQDAHMLIQTPREDLEEFCGLFLFLETDSLLG